MKFGIIVIVYEYYIDIENEYYRMNHFFNICFSIFIALEELKKNYFILFYNYSQYKANVNKTQIFKLTELMLNKIFADDEIGLLSDFCYDIQIYSLKNRTDFSNVPENINKKKY